MVEFGLKLEDNKVAEWSDHYIRYEKLKNLLKKCKPAVERYNQLYAEQPEIAAKIEAAFRQGWPTPQPSKENLAAASGSSSPPGETSSLVGESPGSDYGSDLPPSETSSAISRAIGKAASGVTDYFSKKSYERLLRDALTEKDARSRDFEVALLEDVDLVNGFYQETLKEMEGRLKLLKESVAQSFAASHGSIPEPPSMDDDGETASEYLMTPLVQNRKHSTTMVRMAQVVKSFTRNLPGQPLQAHQQRLSDIPLLPVDEDAEDTPMDKEAVVRKAREAESVQRALVDMYRRAKLLQNFAIMNYTGFVKIVKKHDKTLPEHKGRYKTLISPENICDEGKTVEKLSEHMEQLYANWFCERSIAEARAQMLPKKGDGLEMDWSQLRLGYRMGMCSVLGLWVCWDCIWGLVSSGNSTIGGRTAFPVFRGCGGLLLLQWFWGCSVWVWSRYRVNYIFLFDFNPNIVLSPLAIFNDAVDNSLVFLLLMLLYYKAGVHAVPGEFPAGVFPFILVVYTVVQLIVPWKTRAPMWKSIWQVITAPMTSPTFYHGYVGDIFTSMVKVFQDLAWTVFFVASGDWLISEDSPLSTRHTWSKKIWYSKILIPILTLLPLWFRFNQCLRRYADTGQRFPHLANAFKYAMSQTVTLFGAFHPLYLNNNTKESNVFQAFWTFAFVASSLYSFVWDVYMDWGLGRPSFGFLGPRLMYPKRYVYFTVICIDLVLRFAWVLTLVPPNSGAAFALPAYLTAVSMMLELFRRTIWGFLRLENEHRSNTAGFRRVDFVPLHFTTGHEHKYKGEKEHRGFSVLVEVAFVTVLVLGAAVASVVAAQHATERMSADEL